MSGRPRSCLSCCTSVQQLWPKRCILCRTSAQRPDSLCLSLHRRRKRSGRSDHQSTWRSPQRGHSAARSRLRWGLHRRTWLEHLLVGKVLKEGKICTCKYKHETKSIHPISSGTNLSWGGRLQRSRCHRPGFVPSRWRCRSDRTEDCRGRSLCRWCHRRPPGPGPPQLGQSMSRHHPLRSTTPRQCSRCSQRGHLKERRALRRREAGQLCSDQEFRNMWLDLTCAECGRSTDRTGTTAMNGPYNNRVLLTTHQVVEVTGGGRSITGGVVSRGGGCLDSVGRGSSCSSVISPADQSAVGGAVQLRRHAGWRTRSWKHRGRVFRKRKWQTSNKQLKVKDILNVKLLLILQLLPCLISKLYNKMSASWK